MDKYITNNNPTPNNNFSIAKDSYNPNLFDNSFIVFFFNK